jgi:hypothetical protein
LLDRRRDLDVQRDGWGGTPAINGTVIPDRFNMTGGASFTLDDCWVQKERCSKR